MNQTRQKRLLRTFEFLWMIAAAVMVVECYVAFSKGDTTRGLILLLLGLYAGFRYVTTGMKRRKL